MKKCLFAALFFPLMAHAQTAQLNFTYKSGSVIGRWKVLDLPTTMFGPGTRQGQLLIYYPAGKDSAHIGLGIWQPGKGETSSLDITEVYSSTSGGSLPGMINKGLTPYSVLPNKDTLWHALVCIHNDFQSSYRAYLSTIIPYIMDKIGLKFNPNYTWASGLSEGGAGTWGIFCIDSLLSRRVHTNVALATGGYDNFLTDQRLIANFKVACRNGVYFTPYVGTQDPGYNPGGFLATDAFLKTNALPGHYFPRVILNGTHSANVWDVPWKSRGFWDSLGSLSYTAPIPPPIIYKVRAYVYADSAVIHSPDRSWITLTDTSVNTTGGTWDIISYPPGPRPVISMIDFHHAYWFGLRPGSYTFGIHAYGGGNSATTINNADGTQTTTFDVNNVDSAQVTVTVVAPPACPVCPPPIVCPPPRTVVGMQLIWFNGILTPTFTYSDGNH